MGGGGFGTHRQPAAAHSKLRDQLLRKRLIVDLRAHLLLHVLGDRLLGGRAFDEEWEDPAHANLGILSELQKNTRLISESLLFLVCIQVIFHSLGRADPGGLTNEGCYMARDSIPFVS